MIAKEWKQADEEITSFVNTIANTVKQRFDAANRLRISSASLQEDNSSCAINVEQQVQTGSVVATALQPMSNAAIDGSSSLPHQVVQSTPYRNQESLGALKRVTPSSATATSSVASISAASPRMLEDEEYGGQQDGYYPDEEESKDMYGESPLPFCL